MKRGIFIVIVLVLTAVFSCQKKAEETKTTKEAVIDEGAKIFIERCSACHGPEGKGDIGPDLTDSEWKYGGTDEDLFETISNGRPGGMPAWKNELSEKKIRKVISYIRELGEKK